MVIGRTLTNRCQDFEILTIRSQLQDTALSRQAVLDFGEMREAGDDLEALVSLGGEQGGISWSYIKMSNMTHLGFPKGETISDAVWGADLPGCWLLTLSMMETVSVKTLQSCSYTGRGIFGFCRECEGCAAGNRGVTPLP